MFFSSPAVYGRNRPIKRTINRYPLGLADLQALPPFGWCSLCGGEIYGAGHSLCRRCQEAGHG